MKTQIAIALKAFAVLTIITGVVYPLLVTGISQVVFNDKANGSIVAVNGKSVGSRLIGQSFTEDKYFCPRPSAIGYNSALSGASNFGPTNHKLDTLIESNKRHFIENNGLDNAIQVPAEMITASASGLDPHISEAAALLQVDRIAKARGFDNHKKMLVVSIIKQNAKQIEFAAHNSKYVNVLELNLKLNKL